ncbi:hypothetical protein BKA70DRAFT_793865 [Coprinopsis sp. MPI-PUGE-AT-0042]|nr:hypothetical protein BKA70DRAFT_793865 [Coprinopsis sp. MPI-PUGE-AT-0042]
MNDQLANDLEALEGPLVSTEELEKVEQEKKARRQTISEYEQEIIAQTTKIDQLEQALADLSGEIAGCRYVPPKIRVLCMAENSDPAWADLRQATVTMDGIKGENEALIKRLKQLEEKWFHQVPQAKRGDKQGLAIAIDAEAERDPIALVVNIVPPFFDDARLDGCEYTRQRGVHAALHYIAKSQSTN